MICWRIDWFLKNPQVSKGFRNQLFIYDVLDTNYLHVLPCANIILYTSLVYFQIRNLKVRVFYSDTFVIHIIRTIVDDFKIFAIVIASLNDSTLYEGRAYLSGMIF